MKKREEYLLEKGVKFSEKRSPRDFNLTLIAMQEYAEDYAKAQEDAIINNGVTSLDFVVWYSGMEKSKVVRAYARYLREVPDAKDLLSIEEWFDYGNPFPPLGVEVIAQNDKWIHPDFNVNGIRIGFLNEQENINGVFLSAEWNNEHDEWMTRENDNPTKWRPILK